MERELWDVRSLSLHFPFPFPFLLLLLLLFLHARLPERKQAARWKLYCNQAVEGKWDRD